MNRRSHFLTYIFLLNSFWLAASAMAALDRESLPNFSTLVEQSGPAVVNIRTTQRVNVHDQQAGDEDLFKRYFGIPNPHGQQAPDEQNKSDSAQEKADPSKNKDNPAEDDEETSNGVGSGFIFTDDGYVLTNAHVVKDADEVFVKLTDRREFRASIIGIDVNTDIAVLKIQGNHLPKVTLGDSNRIKVGEWVIAIGSPFDLESSITAGIISAKAREIGDFLLLLQTDVAINPGNSGGPLINMQGEVIGINSQIYSRSGGYMGISFAIPINDAIRVAEQLKQSGTVHRGRLGVYLGDVSKDVAQAFHLQNSGGTLISRIEKNGPADKAGLEDGDIILKFNETSIEKNTELRRLSAASQPGEKVRLTILRRGAVKEIAVVLGELSQPVQSKHDSTLPAAKKDNDNPSLGLAVQSLDEARKKELSVHSGVMIIHSEGRAARAGLQTEDLILSVNNQDPKSEQDFNAIIAKINTKKTVVILAKRGGATQYIAIPAVE